MSLFLASPPPSSLPVRRQYVLQSVRDYDTATLFLEMVGRFRGYAGAHGASAEGNPSGGNVYRGLYNIALKSLGAPPDADVDRQG